MLRSGRNFDHDRRWATVNVGESMAIQSAKEECDINTIVKRFGITGVPANVALPPALTDFQDAFDFQSSLDRLNEATRSFMSMTADTRARFLNDPHRFVAFCSERDHNGQLVNRDEMVKYGLALPKVEPVIPPPVRVEVVNAPAPQA